MSLNAEIMYGMVLFDGEETVVNVPWRKSGDDDEDEDEDFENWIVIQLGLEPLDWSTYPEESYVPTRGNYTEYTAKMKVLRDEWAKRVDSKAYYAKAKELLATVPVEEDYGGTEDYHTIILRLKDSPKVNAYYSAVAFDPMALEVPEDGAAIAFLGSFGVNWVGRWLLVPSYG